MWFVPLLCLAASLDGKPYEEQLIAWGLAQVHREPEPFPEGKRVEEILVASENIIASEDPWPKLLNAFHVKTKEHIIRQEVLLNVGEPYRGELAAETERNLRNLFILAVARVVPVKGKTPQTVTVLIVTKDLVSIRLNSQFQTVGTLLQYLRLQPSELNFLGLNKRLSLDFLLRLDTLSLGEVYTDPRILGTRLLLSEGAAIIFNRHTQQAEGSRGFLSFGRPLYALDTTWGFALSGSWLVDTVRLYRGARIWQLPYPGEAQPSATVPYIYDRRELGASGVYTLSFGRAYKTDVSAGYGGYSDRFAAPLDAGLTEEQRGWLVANYLPHSENATYVRATVRTYQANYRVFRDIESFAVSEDYQLGYMGVFRATWAEPAFLSPIRYLALTAGGSYRIYKYENLATLSAAVSARLASVPNSFGSHWINRRAAVEWVHFTSPVLIGRFALRASVEVNSLDLERRVLFLGGGEGLRGIPAEAQAGPKLFLLNLEYRTRPFVFETLHIGGVLFWDTGSAFQGAPSLVHAVGLGLRILFPQFNKVPLRIDIGYVLNDTRPPFFNWISSSFGQVFDYRPALLESLGLDHVPSHFSPF